MCVDVLWRTPNILQYRQGMNNINRLNIENKSILIKLKKVQFLKNLNTNQFYDMHNECRLMMSVHDPVLEQVWIKTEFHMLKSQHWLWQCFFK